MGKQRLYTYTKLKHVQVGCTYNVYGVVRYCGKVASTRGPQYKLMLSIVDESLDESEKLKCVLFDAIPDHLPKDCTGKIIRMHRLKVLEYNKSKQGRDGMQFSWVLFSSEKEDDFTALSYNYLSYQMHDSDIERVTELRNWLKTPAGIAALQDDNTTSEPRDSTLAPLKYFRLTEYHNVVVQVVSTAIVSTDQRPFLVLRVWDGTKCMISLADCELGDATVNKHDELVAASHGRAYDVCVYDEHVKDIQDVKPGEYVYFVNLHVMKHSCANNTNSTCTIDEPHGELTLHTGRTYGRNVSVVSPNCVQAEDICERSGRMSSKLEHFTRIEQIQGESTVDLIVQVVATCDFTDNSSVILKVWDGTSACQDFQEFDFAPLSMVANQDLLMNVGHQVVDIFVKEKHVENIPQIRVKQFIALLGVSVRRVDRELALHLDAEPSLNVTIRKLSRNHPKVVTLQKELDAALLASQCPDVEQLSQTERTVNTQNNSIRTVGHVNRRNDASQSQQDTTVNTQSENSLMESASLPDPSQAINDMIQLMGTSTNKSLLSKSQSQDLDVAAPPQSTDRPEIRKDQTVPSPKRQRYNNDCKSQALPKDVSTIDNCESITTTALDVSKCEKPTDIGSTRANAFCDKSKLTCASKAQYCRTVSPEKRSDAGAGSRQNHSHTISALLKQSVVQISLKERKAAEVALGKLQLEHARKNAVSSKENESSLEQNDTSDTVKPISIDNQKTSPGKTVLSDADSGPDNSSKDSYDSSIDSDTNISTYGSSDSDSSDKRQDDYDDDNDVLENASALTQVAESMKRELTISTTAEVKLQTKTNLGAIHCYRLRVKMIPTVPRLIRNGALVELVCPNCCFMCEVPRDFTDVQPPFDNTKSKLNVNLIRSPYKQHLAVYQCPHCRTDLEYRFVIGCTLIDESGYILAMLANKEANHFFDTTASEYLLYENSYKHVMTCIKALCPLRRQSYSLDTYAFNDNVPWTECCVTSHTFGSDTRFHIYKTKINIESD